MTCLHDYLGVDKWDQTWEQSQHTTGNKPKNGIKQGKAYILPLGAILVMCNNSGLGTLCSRAWLAGGASTFKLTGFVLSSSVAELSIITTWLKKRAGEISVD